jgi:hypothetical protein
MEKLWRLKGKEFMKRKCSPMKSLPRAGVTVVLLLLVAAASSCGGGTSAPPVGLPGAPPVVDVNSYVGQPGDSPTDNSLWSININRTANTYSYGPTSGPATTGSTAILNNNFVVLLGANGYQSGLAVENPGQGIILRPGDSTAPLVFAVQQPSCFSIGGNVKFLYALSPGINGPTSPFFGEIYAATSSDGSWQFNNQTNFVSPYQFSAQEGSNVPSASEFPGYPGDFPATCAASNGAATVSATPLAYFNGGADTFPVPTQFVISPGGLLFENQNYASVPVTEGLDYTNVSDWGVSEPDMPLVVGGFAAANYVGFLFESDPSSAIYRTRLVGFGNAPIAGTVMNGGTFPNEDPTQPVTVNMSVTFNTQDPLNNGVYYLAKLTIPNDAPSTFTGSCLSYGVSTTGTSTCTNDGVAMVGQQNTPGVGAQYTIIMSASDANGDQKTLVLFQQ